MQQCLNSYSKQFTGFSPMLLYHEEQSCNTKWQQTVVNQLHVEPLDSASPLIGDLSRFAPNVTREAVDDTAVNLGLAVRIDNDFYPLRDTAFKSLADRAKTLATLKTTSSHSLVTGL